MDQQGITEIQSSSQHKEKCQIHVYTLGSFQVIRDGVNLGSKYWGRDKSIQLMQFVISNRSRSGLHKDQIIDRLWGEASDRDFKVAMHGINKALEPDRPSRSEPSYILRNGISYHLNLNKIWIDIHEAEQFIIAANQCHDNHTDQCIALYRAAIDLYEGTYLPNRLYEDWSAEERERMQVLFIGAYTDLASLIIDDHPMEAIRLMQTALQIDPLWEEAYRIQIQAYINRGNRPMAIKTYDACVTTLDREYGIAPLPETMALIQSVKAL